MSAWGTRLNGLFCLDQLGGWGRLFEGRISHVALPVEVKVGVGVGSGQCGWVARRHCVGKERGRGYALV